MYNVLNISRSPVQRGLMDYLTYLFRNHKNEVDHVFASDPILKSELEYDVRVSGREKENLPQAANNVQVEKASATSCFTRIPSNKHSRRKLQSV